MKHFYILVAALLAGSSSMYSQTLHNPNEKGTVTTVEVKSEEEELGQYELNFPQDLTSSYDGRRLQSFSLTGTQGSSYTSATISNDPRTVYVDKTNEVAWVLQGEQLNLSLTGYAESWMHTYLYIDYDSNGIFSIEIGSNKIPTENSELVCFSYRDGVNSLGETKSNSNLTAPAFTIPASLPEGTYRARLKIDWDNDDPKGRYVAGAASNNIDTNGGYVIDFLLHVSASANDGILRLESPNGNIYAANNYALPYTLHGVSSIVAYPQPVTDGYELAGPVEITSGTDFTGPEFDRVGNRQWYKATLTPQEVADADGLWIPVYGPVTIKANFEATANAEYKLVFNDEFDGEDGSRPDDTKWASSNRAGSTWNRFVSDSPEVAYVSDGNLVLRAIANPDKSTDDADMLTGALQTRNLFSFKYGLLECRAKINKHSGNFPAIWMMPQDQTAGWPDCGEIDIFEQINTEDISYHTIHSHWTYGLGQTYSPRSSFTGYINMERYHTYGFKWEEELLTWYIDGREIGSYARSTVESQLNNGQWPFDKEFYLILNQSVGDGSWADAPDLAYTYQMDVDWVRIYQIAENTGTSIKETAKDRDVSIRVNSRAILLNTTTATHISVTNIVGQTLFSGVVDGSHSVSVPQGIYIVNNQKVIVP